MGFEMCKAHLDLLALIAGSLELRRTHEAARMIAGILVDVASDLARGRVRTALRLEWTCAAVAPRCTIAHLVVAAHVAGGLEQLVRGTDIDVTLTIEREVVGREGSVITIAHVLHRNVRRDAGADEPAEELAGAIGRVGQKPFGLQALRPLGT